MRIRLFGQYVHATIAALAAVETAAFFLALIIAGLIRFQFDVDAIELYQGSILPGQLFSAWP